MTADVESADRRRSLRDDLLHDLEQQGATVPPTRAPSAPDQRTPSAAPPETPSVELRITPRVWSPFSWSPRTSRAGFTVTAGPLRLSLSRAGS